MARASELAKSAFRQGESDIKGYRKDDPVLQHTKEISIEEIDQQFSNASQESINKFTGKTDSSRMDTSFSELIKSFSYRAGVLKGQKKKYPTPALILSRAKKFYK